MIRLPASDFDGPNAASRSRDGLRRETREETGLDVELIALTGAYKNMVRGIIALVFLCKITGRELAITDETTAYRWADQETICELAAEAYAIRVLDALYNDHPPAVRHHDGKHLL
jgi:8-oxo-dGTP diphosphatase